MIDLSHTIHKDMTIYPGSGVIEVKKAADIVNDGYNELSLKITTHTGTHIDAPAHLIMGGKTLDNFPAEHFIGNACLIHCSNIPIIEKDLIISALKNIEIPEFILFYTGWDRKWTDKSYFENYPILSEKAAEYISHLSIRGVGIDAPSFDAVGSHDLHNHHTLMQQDILLIENLCNLDKLSPLVTLFCLPLKINQADGSPARVVAINK